MKNISSNYLAMEGASLTVGSFTHKITVDEIVNQIKGEVFKETIAAIRAESDKKKRNDLKKGLRFFNLGMSKDLNRKAEFFQNSEFFLLDIDGLSDAVTVNKLKQDFSRDKRVHFVFVSPSGNGLKVAFRLDRPITDAQTFSKAYKVFAEEIRDQYKVKTDHTSDCLRVCYYSHDPDIYYNPDSEVLILDLYLKADEKSPRRRSAQRRNGSTKKSESTGNADNVSPLSHLLDFLATVRLSYDDWIRIGFFLCSQVDGEQLFTEMSVKNLHFDDTKEVVIEKFRSLNENYDPRRDRITIATLHYIAGKHGYKPRTFIQIIDDDKVHLSYDRFYTEFMPASGFFHSNGKLVHIDKGIIRSINVDEWTELVFQCFDSLEITESERSALREYCTRASDSLFNRKRIRLLPSFCRESYRDSKTTCNLFFQNDVWLEITENDVKVHSMTELSQPIECSQVISHDFKQVKLSENFDFVQFIRNITSDCNEESWKPNDIRYLSLVSAIGYALHNFKDPSNSKAVVFMDKPIVRNGELVADGGTGKSLVAKAIAIMTAVKYSDGKRMKMDSQFLFQQVEQGTRILVINDPKKGFDFEYLFNAITDGLEVEKKGETAIWIPFEDSPKLLLTSNYVLSKNESSYKRRMFEVEFSHFYGDKVQPNKEFGRNFFTQWNPEDWAQFFAFMIRCIQTYLKYGLIEVKVEESAPGNSCFEFRQGGRRTGSFMDEIEHQPVEPLTESELFGESEAE